MGAASEHDRVSGFHVFQGVKAQEAQSVLIMGSFRKLHT